MDRSLYLAYRPQTFAEVVEQEHVSRTLSNAIETDRLAHAYLFCGPRGTGKTSTARILAKALNCEKGPTPNPCGECDNCVRIRNGSTMDVVELDAASNRGIDEIRKLRENVQYAPAEGRYKFYIVDEAHQITKDAFNALLKTLEEPPPYVVFVLATTEPDRLPATILSRCQRFDFKRLSSEKLAAHLTKVAASEGVDIDDAAVRTIARAADGAARDGLTILEQMMSFSEGRITQEDVVSVLGFTEMDVLCALSRAVIDGDSVAIVDVVDRVVETGRDLHQLLKDLAGHFRDLLVLSLGADSAELKALAPEARAIMTEQAKSLDRARGVRLIDVISQAQGDLRWNPQHRLVVELALLKAAECLPTAAPAAPAARAAAAPPRPAPSPAPARPAPATRPESTPPRAEAPRRTPAAQATPRPATAPEPAAPSTEVEHEPVASPGEVDVATVKDRWPEALAAVKRQSVPVHALLVDSMPLAVAGDVIVLGFSHQFHRDHCAEPQNRALVESVIRPLFGALRIDCQRAAEWTANALAHDDGGSDEEGDSAAADPDPDAFIRQVVDMFGGTILDQSLT
ncbi:MAG: DNA polymerase III subunit gamma/tau [Armatimonadetes bacterium CG_4_10_14_3_um_filter_66_18]|nr:DNA polymerase III subunit gamma/tau [Armatimonadota bacterium]OIP03216.1 MAG: DNA polymerase III, subunit gamma and tau [Armatimonadetes bacterium CG2_30_66_41]PIU90295.1 MAG: DNA polymerase III subunit gamma/tau [Armatimonadetes bacterium CG06_land_8_20_14_3_00_66_21]PIX45689.1 MAG: DNA polymerase III subunit gamma/tau [Armatimonadetes bacterium CG_4_8_14_3_um_filter_66_20]PIY43325.1 MAG: DNA polymerase III subunit gamma/tau [Armatimonadetes bacterium CG_4_10_14_3_um_filter_66_18]PIZ31085